MQSNVTDTTPRHLAFIVHLQDIEWDITDEEWERKKNSLDLPIDYEHFTWAYDIDEAINFAIDKASDEHGFCILNCDAHVIPGFEREW